MLFGDSAGQAVLDEIVGPRHIPAQGARIATQARDFRLEQPTEIVHRITSSCFARALALQ
jgi:hypothetical protein